jgi:metallo-beta-lactamase class B
MHHQRIAFVLLPSIWISFAMVAGFAWRSAAQEPRTILVLGENLKVEQLSENVWRHISYQELEGFGRSPANGLVVVSGKQAALVDTPWTDSQTSILSDWVSRQLGAKVTAVVVTHSHPDNLGGLAEAHRLGAESYAYEMTVQFARETGKEIPRNAISASYDLNLGSQRLELRHLGGGHTFDNIVVWIPNEKILFGGCLVRSAAARTLGYTREADLANWAKTIERLVRTYGGKAELVVPGHSSPKGMELPAGFLERLRQQEYLFYLHGKIVEDQGIHAVSDEYGPYQYEEIVETLKGHGFEVISEVRSKDTNPETYAQKVVQQIQQLRAGGVPTENITVLGASKGAGIAVFVSDLLEEEAGIDYILLAICSPGTLDFWQSNDICVSGNVLSIYDEKDKLAGSCMDFFHQCEDSGLRRHKEIRLEVGTGHGIVYQPLDEWIDPLLEWVR